jgi:Neural proliferation differentiation control-1 protein (NPDC1)
MKNPNSEVALGDKKLAHSAQMFHYQHQKNQIIAMENRNGTEMGHNDEDNDSDENENDFTVYGERECGFVFSS